MNALRMTYTLALLMTGFTAAQAEVAAPEVLFQLNADDSRRLEPEKEWSYFFILKPITNVWIVGEPIESDYYAKMENQQCRFKNVKVGRYILFVARLNGPTGVTIPVGRFTISKSLTVSLRIPELSTRNIWLPVPPGFNAKSWPSLNIESRTGLLYGYQNDVTLIFDPVRNVLYGTWDNVPKSGRFRVDYHDKSTNKRLRLVDVTLDGKGKLSVPLRLRFADGRG